MAINLASKYADKIAEVYTANSFIAGKCCKDWNFTGVKSLTIYTPTTVPLTDYSRSGANRYGDGVEMEDTIQELTMSQDKKYKLIIDKGNLNEQLMIKQAGKMMKAEINEQVVPLIDKYAFSQLTKFAGKIQGMTEPSKTTIVEAIANGETYLTDNLIPENDRYLYISGSMYNKLRLSDEYIKLEGTGVQALEKGVVGEIMGLKVVKVPTSYLPTGCYFIIAQKSSWLLPHKINDNRIITDSENVSGSILVGRHNYDTFVIGTRANGIYVAVASASVATTPTIEITSNNAAITGTSGAVFKYTLDGTDPRYSKTAITYTSAVAMTSGQTIKAYATETGKYTSAVAVETND